MECSIFLTPAAANNKLAAVFVYRDDDFMLILVKYVK